MAATWTTTVDFEGMTWGDLRQLVKRAKDLGDDEPVVFDTDEGNDFHPMGIKLDETRS